MEYFKQYNIGSSAEWVSRDKCLLEKEKNYYSIFKSHSFLEKSEFDFCFQNYVSRKIVISKK